MKRILEELGVEYSTILLFGSRTGKNFEEESDWDFLIVVKGNLDLKEKRELWHKIYRRFHEYFPFISVDVRVTKTHDLETMLALYIEKDKKFERFDKFFLSFTPFSRFLIYIFRFVKIKFVYTFFG
ncbi:MAG: nucleotidyltransferase domain-containing protein [Methanophagales archaeon]|nr:nucleotidyltransferase domain-containing protein [Methanophagales archaeon]